MSATEFDLWRAYNDLRPFGNAAADLRAGIVANAIGGGGALKYMPIVKKLIETPTMTKQRHRNKISDMQEKAKLFAAQHQTTRT